MALSLFFYKGAQPMARLFNAAADIIIIIVSVIVVGVSADRVLPKVS